MTRVIFKSDSIFWNTPRALYKKLNNKFNFNFDPCPSVPSFDGLNVAWGSRNFVNPPYGKEISKWIEKGYEEYLKNKLVVFLIPVRGDTKYWHDFILRANEIWFIRGRLKFNDDKGSAPFASAIIIFDPENTNQQKIYSKLSSGDDI